METKICEKCGLKKSINEYRLIHNKYYSNKCRECINLQSREYYKTHKNQHNKIVKKYYQKNKEKIDNYRINWEKEHKKQILERHRQYYKKRNKEDNIFKIKHTIRTSILQSFKNKNFIKNSKVKDILCCDWETFYNHLLKTFENNYGYKWNGIEKVHIDHIIPLDSAKSEDDIIKLNHYTNLQLLKPKDNLKKSNKTNWKLKEVNKNE